MRAQGNLNGSARGRRPATPGLTLEPLTLVGKLSKAESEEFGRCEDTIRKGWRNFVEVGEALLEIHDKRLYRDRFLRFEEYYREVWQYEKSQVYRLMEAAKVVRVLSPVGENVSSPFPLPICEAQVRPLVGLETGDIKNVWRQAVREAEAKEGPITARLVQNQVRAISRPSAESSRANGSNSSQYQRDRSLKIEKGVAELVGMIGGDEAKIKRAEELQRLILALIRPRAA